METFVWVGWSLAAAALVLAGAAVALVYRGVGRRAWLTYGMLSLGVGVAMTSAAHAAVYSALVPWWRTGAGYGAVVSGPLLAAGWVGRWSTRHRPAWPRWRFGVATVVALLVAGLIGTRIAAAVLPQYEIINAVQ